MFARPRNSDLPEKKNKQVTVSLSTAEAEYVAFSITTQDVKTHFEGYFWILECNSTDERYTRRQPRSYIAIARNAVPQASSKHDHIGYHFFR